MVPFTKTKHTKCWSQAASLEGMDRWRIWSGFFFRLIVVRGEIWKGDEEGLMVDIGWWLKWDKRVLDKEKSEMWNQREEGVQGIDERGQNDYLEHLNLFLCLQSHCFYDSLQNIIYQRSVQSAGAEKHWWTAWFYITSQSLSIIIFFWRHKLQFYCFVSTKIYFFITLQDSYTCGLHCVFSGCKFCIFPAQNRFHKEWSSANITIQIPIHSCLKICPFCFPDLELLARPLLINYPWLPPKESSWAVVCHSDIHNHICWVGCLFHPCPSDNALRWCSINLYWNPYETLKALGEYILAKQVRCINAL